MKQLILILTILTIVSCNDKKEIDTNKLIENKDISALEQKRYELVNQIDFLQKDLNTIISALNRLDSSKKRVFVTVIPVKTSKIKNKISLQSIIKTNQNIVLQPEFTGPISNIKVVEGQSVNKGDVLMIVDDGGLEQSVEFQKEQLKLSKTIFERQSRLWADKIGSEIEYLEAKTAFKTQKSRYSQLNEQLQKSVITAPFDGEIDDIFIELGELVTPGQSPLLRLISTSEMYLEAEVPEKYLKSVSVGTPVEIEIPVLNKKINTKVSFIGKHINTVNRTFRVVVKIKKTDSLSPNLISTLHIFDYINNNALIIPTNIISENSDGSEYVYSVNNNNTAQKIFIKTGNEENGYVEVIEGLKENDIIINEGARLVKEGQAVQIVVE
ncbi:MAG: efflux RND transporter periplasmic adaptor subunit [Bacteroidota bacterium]|jgi:RND family efflux transporter MFP subunit|nr:efflux RND transporter periplasmic adaptor subunit [Bacteroidota bacterium]MEC9160924.1 efflux RND transporter periplasmic adaptor subunit [Bacteroidota bacterium]|tara:strand:- start:6488 stop:7636 length:1149 start_codon:yes stop_codon:yes gene_type:complete